MMRDWEDRSDDDNSSFSPILLAFLAVLPLFGWIDDLFQLVQGLL